MPSDVQAPEHAGASILSELDRRMNTTNIQGKMESITSMRKYLVSAESASSDPTGLYGKMPGSQSMQSSRTIAGGGKTQEEIATEEMDEGDLATIEVAEMADQTLPEVQKYLAMLMGSIRTTVGK